ncbi:MAG: hypothetical protein JSW51_15060 [Gemmatimonadota bacterium]|nr:MAG: hypothetical protein JSW51_15060 [Gemmatimonadota bacterium]
MYSTCLFCNRPLASNEVIEHFPIGRRLAFDGEKGRLWVVCRKCERWNLTPLEERWEAIEECEREFRATRMRMSTDEIGLARLREGLELVRIGEPLRPEFAAWRYGDQFGRRRKRAMLWTAGAVAATGVVVAGAAAAGAGVFGGIHVVPQLIANIPVRARIKTKDGRVLKVRKQNLEKSRILVDGGRDEWSVYVKHQHGEEHFEGEEAVKAVGLLLPGLNEMIGTKPIIEEAVDRIEEAGDPEAYLSRVAEEVRKQESRDSSAVFKKKPGLIVRLPKPTKLAIEMAVHEESERRALAGELLMLENAWREAEEIASIADNMFVPKETEEFIERHRAAQ